MLDPDIAELYKQRDRMGILPTFQGTPDGSQCRERYASFHALISKPRCESVTEDTAVVEGPNGPIPVAIFRPGQATEQSVVFFHGGGFVVGGIGSHRDHAERIAESTNSTVVSVDYRLAPEHRFPAGLHDCIAVVDSLVDDGIDFEVPRLTGVSGDSAGGNLALNAAVHLIARRYELKGLLLIYPATDLEALSSIGSHAWANELYAPGEDMSDPRLSTINADLAGLPTTVLTVGTEDFLLEDNRALHSALVQASVDVHLFEPEGLPHGFFHLGSVSETAESACREALGIFGETLNASQYS